MVELEPPRRRGERAGGADRADELEVAKVRLTRMPGFLLAGNACGAFRFTGVAGGGSQSRIFG